MKNLLLAAILAVASTCALAQSSGGNHGGGGAGNGVGSGAAPVMAFYLGNSCPVANTGQCFNTPSNTQVQTGCTTSTSNANVVCPTGTFAAADVGKKMFGSGTCNPFTPQAGLLWAAPVTINSFTDSTTVAVSANALFNGSTFCIVWGNPDDTAAAALDTFIQSAANTGLTCPKVFLTAAQYMWTTPHFFTQPGGCLAIPSIQGHANTQGNMYLAAGFELEGRGPGATIIWLPPDFPESGACNHGTDGTSTACFAVPLEGRFSDFQFSGTSGLAGTNIGNGNALLQVDVGSLDYFTCTSIGDFSSSTTHTGILITHWAQLQQVNVSACGDIGVQVANGAQASAFRLSSENASSINTNSANLNVVGSFTCFYCNFYGNQAAATNAVGITETTGGNLTLYHPQFNITSGTNGFAYICRSAGCVLNIHGGQIVQSGGVTNFWGINCSSSCTADVQGLSITANGTGNTYAGAAGSVFINHGGNNFTGGAGVSNSGSILNLDSQGVTAITAAKAVLSAGWGNTPTAAWSALNGGNSYTGTITNGTVGLGASPTITYTFPTPFLSTPNICQATQIGGTFSPVGTFTTSAVSTTGATFTFSTTPTASTTEVVAIFCQ